MLDSWQHRNLNRPKQLFSAACCLKTASESITTPLQLRRRRSPIPVLTGLGIEYLVDQTNVLPLSRAADSALVAADPQTPPERLPSTSIIAIYYYYSAWRHTPILSSRRGWRPDRPKHWNKGAQPVPKAVYRSGCRDKHNCPRRDLNLASLTPQSLLPLDHCDL